MPKFGQILVWSVIWVAISLGFSRLKAKWKLIRLSPLSILTRPQNESSEMPSRVTTYEIHRLALGRKVFDHSVAKRVTSFSKHA